MCSAKSRERTCRRVLRLQRPRHAFFFLASAYGLYVPAYKICYRAVSLASA